jgi:multimeric flavodoxin WrbA
LGQVSDWINDIYPRWAACHGALIVTPVHWYQLARPLDQALDWDTPVQQVVGNVAAAIAAPSVCCAPASWHGPIVI